MGYASGRKHTYKSLENIASQFKTRGEFKRLDPSAYSASRRRGKEFMDSICEHMISMKYSTPQLLAKRILENILNEKCMYNTRQVIKPYELDIYFPTYKLAIEYNGINWHKDQETKDRDKIKMDMCADLGITLLILLELNTNRFNYEKDVKDEIYKNLEKINEVSGKNINRKDVLRVDCSDIYDEIEKYKDMGSLEDKISQCRNILDFEKKFSKEYTFLRMSKQLHRLDPIREPANKFSDEYLIEQASKIGSFKEMRKNDINLYHNLRRRGLMDIATSHMVRKKRNSRS